MVILTAAVVLTTTALILQLIVLHDTFLSFVSSPLAAVADPVSRYLTKKFGERFLSRSDMDKSRQLKRKRDFETRREEISALYMSKATKKTWKLDIVYKEPGKKDVRINISGEKHYQILRNLVDAFSKLQPTIYFREY